MPIRLFLSDSSSVIFAKRQTSFQFPLNDKLYQFCNELNAEKEGDMYSQVYENGLSVTFRMSDNTAAGLEW